jgi:hypothetical protein
MDQSVEKLPDNWLTLQSKALAVGGNLLNKMRHLIKKGNKKFTGLPLLR